MFETIIKSIGLFKSLYRSKKIYINISSNKYNKVLQELGKKWGSSTRDSDICVYTHNSYEEKAVIHIKNEDIASRIFLALSKGVCIPEKFNNLRFINIRKQNQSVFAIFDTSNKDSEISNGLLSYADEFCELFSTEDSKIYVDYAKLSQRGSRDYWNVALFESLSLEPFENSYKQLTAIVFEILENSGYEYSWFHLRQYSSSRNDHDPFLYWLRRGVFRADSREPGRLPLNLEINILRFTLNPDFIKDVHEFWTKDIVSSPYSNNLTYVIDENLFSKSIVFKKEINDFFFYEDAKSSYIYAKYKEDTNTQEYEESLSNALDRKYITDVGFLLSSNMGKYIFFSKEDKTTLSKLIKTTKNNIDSFLTLIRTIDTWGTETENLKGLSFHKDTNFLDVISMEQIERYPVLINPTALVFKENTPSIPFDHRHLIMLVIKEYMKCRSIQLKDIYSFKVINTLSLGFTKALIKFIETGAFDDKSDYSVFNGCSISQVEFIENIDTNDTSLMAKITLTGNHNDFILSQSFKETLEKIKGEQKANGYISLNDLQPNVLLLNSSTVYELFKKYELLQDDFFMAPEKVLISKNDSLHNQSYVIVGFVWKYYALKKAVDVISSGDINCKELYLHIHHLLEKSLYFEINITRIPNLNSIWYIDTTTNRPVLCDRSLDYSKYCYNSKYTNPIEYYNSIIGYLDGACGFKSKYDLFDFTELVPNKYHKNYERQLVDMHIAISSMKHCEYHKHWHLADRLCPICDNVFDIINLTRSKQEVYSNELGIFFSDEDDNTIYSLNSNIPSLDYLRLAFEADFFKNFTGLVPYKMIISNDKISDNSILYDTENEDFDLEQGILPLESFKNVQRLKVILVMYKKILPLISEQRFITTNPKIFNTFIMHKDFKGEIIIPGLPLLEYGAILSSDTKFKESRTLETKKAFADFLVKYIKDDEFLKKMLSYKKNLFVNIVNDISELSFSPEAINTCLEHYKNFCITHGTAYASDRTFCPLCAKLGFKPSNTVLENRAYFTALQNRGSEYDGGEADIYPYNDTQVQKIFKSHVDPAFKAKIISKALEKAPLIEEFNRTHDDIKIISVDKVLYMRDGHNSCLKGFTQEFIRNAHTISCLKDKNFVKDNGYTRKDIIKILINVSKGIEFIHSIGGFIGDLNGGNVLIKGTYVYFIDIDGMSFDDVKNCVYTNMYIYPPSAESNNISAEDDWYSLAVQAFYYLTYSHPFRGISNDKKIPVNETERMKLGMSLLGNHKIVPPNICLGWDFISSNLIQYFLDTFEGKKRESMLSLLEEYLSLLLKQEMFFVEEPRKQVLKNLNENTYINTDHDIVYKGNTIFNVSGYSLINTNKNGIVVSFNNHSYFYDINNNKSYTLKKTYSSSLPMSICNGNIYYTSNDRCTLMVDTPDSETGIHKTHSIKKPSEYPIIRLRVDESNRFVFVEDNTDLNTFDIYCNSVKVHNISQKHFTKNVRVGILYDVLSGRWLVVYKDSPASTLVIIEKDSKVSSVIQFEKTLSTYFCFYGNTLYYVGDNNIYFYNVNTRSHKCIECKFASKDSYISRYDDKFVIMDKVRTYVYQKS